ncbi:MAG: flippase-like domain-containing protein [Deltaproteobacteria bacterium]|nr:flippase-like domain-containing protein [Deltaproteobacteria bacterium]
MIRFLLGLSLMISVVLYAAFQGPLLKSILSLPLASLFEVTLLYLVSQIVSAVKWYLVLRSLSEKTSFIECLRAYFLGMYVNSFGLGIVGGDLVRAFAITVDSKKKAIASVLFDRIHGLFVLALLGGVAGILSLPSRQLSFVFVPGCQILIAIITFSLFFSRAPLTFLSKFSSLQKLNEIVGLGWAIKLGDFLKISLISLVFHVLQLFALLIFSLRIGVELDVFFWLSVMPLVNIVSALPISWNGMGTREALMMFYMTPTPFNATEIILFSMIWLSAVMVGSFIGALWSLFHNLNVKNRT